MLHHNTAYMFQTVISVSPTNIYVIKFWPRVSEGQPVVKLGLIFWLI